MEKCRGFCLLGEGPVCVFLDREDPVWGTTIPSGSSLERRAGIPPATQVDKSLADHGSRGRLAHVLPVLCPRGKSSSISAERQEDTYKSAEGTRGSNIPGVNLARPKPRALQNCLAHSAPL